MHFLRISLKLRNLKKSPLINLNTPSLIGEMKGRSKSSKDPSCTNPSQLVKKTQFTLPSSHKRTPYKKKHSLLLPALPPVLPQKSKEKNHKIETHGCSDRHFSSLSSRKEEELLKRYKAIENMRKLQTAPVDTMGAYVIGDPQLKENDPELFNYKTLIGLLLSSQTRDQQTAQAITNLNQFGLSIQNMIDADQEQIDFCIKGVGFHAKKANYIKKCSLILKQKHQGKVPRTLKELLDLPGIGIKMAHLVLQICFGIVEGISVDTHVHRISNRISKIRRYYLFFLDFVRSSTVEGTKFELEQWLPKEYWAKINTLFVGIQINSTYFDIKKDLDKRFASR